MLKSNFLRIFTVALMSVLLLSSGAFAGNEYSHAIDKDSDTPWYLQLMAYVSQLMTAGEEVPKQLLQKVDQYYRQGR